MKFFNFHIIKQKTLDGKLAKARKDAIVIPNKMISRLLVNQADQPIVKQLLVEYRQLHSRYQWLRNRIRNA